MSIFAKTGPLRLDRTRLDDVGDGDAVSIGLYQTRLGVCRAGAGEEAKVVDRCSNATQRRHGATHVGRGESERRADRAARAPCRRSDARRRLDRMPRRRATG